MFSTLVNREFLSNFPVDLLESMPIAVMICIQLAVMFHVHILGANR